MAKQSGLGDNFYVGEFNLSGDIAALQRVASPRAVLPMTGIDKSAHERAHAHKDGALQATCLFNDAAGQAHPVLSAMPTTDRVMTYFRGTTIGKPAACMVAKQIGYDGTRGDDGSFR